MINFILCVAGSILGLLVSLVFGFLFIFILAFIDCTSEIKSEKNNRHEYDGNIYDSEDYLLDEILRQGHKDKDPFFMSIINSRGFKKND